MDIQYIHSNPSSSAHGKSNDLSNLSNTNSSVHGKSQSANSSVHGKSNVISDQSMAQDILDEADDADRMSPKSSSPIPPFNSEGLQKGSEGESKEGVVSKGLLDRLKSLGTKIFPGTTGSNPRPYSRGPYDYMVETDTMCLGSSAQEVVPFISSSSKNLLPYEGIQYHFQQGVLEVTARTKGGEGDTRDEKMAFPAPCRSDQGIIYFGIDCRDERERTLGLFPRSFCINSSFMSDTDEITKLLVTLEPLASSLHLCIIGNATQPYIMYSYFI